MPQPDLILTPFAQDAPPSAVDPIPENRAPTDPLEKASWTQGFPGLTMIPLAAGGIPPRGQDVNGVLRAISEHVAFQGGGGQYKWSAEYVAAKGGYEKGAVIQSDDGLSSYVSAVDGNAINPNTAPGSIGNQWIANGGAAKANASTTITAGLGLSGGGDLSGNRTISANFGTTAGTVMEGNDPRIAGAAQKSANLSDLASASDARQNLGLGTAATRDVGLSSGDVVVHGIESLIVIPSNTDVNTFSFGTIISPTAYLADNTLINAPLPNTWWHIRKTGTTGWVYFEALSGNGRTFKRYAGDAGVLEGPWIEALSTGTIQNTVGQSTDYPMSQKAVTDELNTKVGLSGNQTVGGIKTFSLFPVTPSAAPTDNYQAANKKYVDDLAIGVGQAWQDVTASRVVGTTYTNTTGKPILVSVWQSSDTGPSLIVDGVVVASVDGAVGSVSVQATAIVPSGSTYRITALVNGWAELR